MHRNNVSLMAILTRGILLKTVKQDIPTGFLVRFDSQDLVKDHSKSQCLWLLTQTSLLTVKLKSSKLLSIGLMSLNAGEDVPLLKVV